MLQKQQKSLQDEHNDLFTRFQSLQRYIKCSSLSISSYPFREKASVASESQSTQQTLQQTVTDLNSQLASIQARIWLYAINN